MVGVLIAAGAPISASGGASAATNHARAERESARLLALIRLPPGASRSATEPPGDQGVLAVPAYDPLTPNLVDAHAWWTVPGKAGDVLEYAVSRMPSGASRWGSGAGNAAPGYATATFAMPPILGVLSQRMLSVTVVQLASDTTGVRTDGETMWIVPRPAWEVVPRAVRSVVFTARGPVGRRIPGPVSVPRRVTAGAARRLAAFVNRLGLVQPGVRFCPAAFFGYVDLRFLSARGKTLAEAIEHPTGCASVSLTVGGRRGPALEDSPSLTNELEAIGAIPGCSHAQLQASATAPTRGPLGWLISFRLRNRSDRVCRVSGSPRLALMAGDGRTTKTSVLERGDGTRPRRASLGVLLDPEQVASIVGTWTTCRAPRARTVRLSLAGIARPFTLHTGSPRRPFAPCRGRVTLSGPNPPF